MLDVFVRACTFGVTAKARGAGILRDSKGEVTEATLPRKFSLRSDLINRTVIRHR